MTQVFHRAKFLVPVLVIVAMLAAVGIVWSQSGGSSDGGSFLPQLTDQNPAYDDQVVAPSDSPAPAVLYSITVDPPTSVVPIGGGTVATFTLTNLIPAAISNGAFGVTQSPTTGLLVSVSALANGDITGDMVVTADVYNNIDTTGCLASYTSGNVAMGPAAADGLPSLSQQIVKIYPNITVHPGLTVTFQVPVMTGATAVPGAEFMLKGALYVPGTTKAWAPGYWVSNGVIYTASGGTLGSPAGLQNVTTAMPKGAAEVVVVYGP